jgi:hypothetical protein
MEKYVDHVVAKVKVKESQSVYQLQRLTLWARRKEKLLLRVREEKILMRIDVARQKTLRLRRILWKILVNVKNVIIHAIVIPNARNV